MEATVAETAAQQMPYTRTVVNKRRLFDALGVLRREHWG
jgi:hypothetical protein